MSKFALHMLRGEGKCKKIIYFCSIDMQVTVFLLVNKKVILFTVNPRYILTS